MLTFMSMPIVPRVPECGSIVALWAFMLLRRWPEGGGWRADSCLRSRNSRWQCFSVADPLAVLQWGAQLLMSRLAGPSSKKVEVWNPDFPVTHMAPCWQRFCCPVERVRERRPRMNRQSGLMSRPFCRAGWKRATRPKRVASRTAQRSGTATRRAMAAWRRNNDWAAC